MARPAAETGPVRSRFRYTAALKKLNDAKTRDKIGYAVLGVGGAAAALGVYLLSAATTPPLRRKERRQPDEPGALYRWSALRRAWCWYGTF